MSVRIYTYGLPFGPDKKDVDAVNDQIRGARVYQNQLIAIEKARRAAYRDLRRRHAPDVVRLEDKRSKIGEELSELRTQIKAANAKARSRKTTADQRGRVKELIAQRKRVNEELKAAREAFKKDPVAKVVIDKCDERANEMVKLHRAACGVYWGTYLLIEQSVKQASKKSDPVHRSWNGNGRIGVQLQGGLPAVAAFGGDTRLQIDPVPEEAFTGSRGVRRKLSRTKCRLRIGSQGRDPVWAEFPLILHRPLPKDGIIKWAWAQRKKIVDGVPVGSGKSRRYRGERWRWELQLVIESESFEVTEPVGHGVCAIDIGWRLRESEDGLRVGMLVDEKDKEEELLLPNVITSKLAHVDELRSQMDTNFNNIRTQLSEWLDGRIVPDWLTQRLRALPLWRSQKRLASVVYRWATHRFDGDDQMFATADAWLKQYHHLNTWLSHERTKTLGRRRETYRLMATEICRRYDTVVIEDINLSEMAKRAEAEEKEALHKTARLQRTRSSPSEFRQSLMLAASNNGTKIVTVPAANTTRVCWVCGHNCVDDTGWDPIRLHQTCGSCGTEWDQDVNAAYNLLAAHLNKDPDEKATKAA